MTLINNPNGAFGQSPNDTAAQVDEFVAGAAVTAGNVVQLTIVSGIPTVTLATAATQSLVGVAVEGAAAGQTVKVATYGPVLAAVSGTTVAAGAVVTTDSDSEVHTGSTTAAQRNLGWALESTAGTAGDLKWIYVAPHAANSV